MGEWQDEGPYRRLVRGLEHAGREVLPLAARFVFAAVLVVYYWSSFRTKVGPGLTGFFTITETAWRQIALPAVDAAGGNIAAIPFFPWGLIVGLGTYAEFLLPLMLVLGLFTRIAAAGMINFIAFQTFVDITVHKASGSTIGALFDRAPDSAILDQRLLWIFVALVLVFKGGGALSLDRLFTRRMQQRRAVRA